MAFEKFFFKFIFFAKLFIDARVRNIVIFWVCAIFTNTRVGNIHMNCSLTLELEIFV